MTYSTYTPTQILTQGVSNALTSTDFSPLIYLSMTSADNHIEAVLEQNNITPPASNDTLTEAGNLFAAAKILDAYYAAKDRRSPTAISYEAEANLLLQGYIDDYLAEHPESDEGVFPLTATHIDNS